MFKCFFNVPPAVAFRVVDFSVEFACLVVLIAFLIGLVSFLLTCELPVLELGSLLSLTRIDNDVNELSVIDDVLDNVASGSACIFDVFVNERDMLAVVMNELFELGLSRILLVVMKVLDETEPVKLSWVRLL